MKVEQYITYTRSIKGINHPDDISYFNRMYKKILENWDAPIEVQMILTYTREMESELIELSNQWYYIMDTQILWYAKDLLDTIATSKFHSLPNIYYRARMDRCILDNDASMYLHYSNKITESEKSLDNYKERAGWFLEHRTEVFTLLFVFICVHELKHFEINTLGVSQKDQELDRTIIRDSFLKTKQHKDSEVNDITRQLSFYNNKFLEEVICDMEAYKFINKHFSYVISHETQLITIIFGLKVIQFLEYAKQKTSIETIISTNIRYYVFLLQRNNPLLDSNFITKIIEELEYINSNLAPVLISDYNYLQKNYKTYQGGFLSDYAIPNVFELSRLINRTYFV